MTKKNTILQLIQCIDLTTLADTDNHASVMKLVHKANAGFQGINPAAVCVFSNFGNDVRAALNPSMKTALVGSCFPSGQTLSAAKIHEAQLIAQTNIDELDIVINRGDALAKNDDTIFEEISKIRSAIGSKHLKVILETGDLKTEERIKTMAKISIDAGADFIKTSTGKTATGASFEAVKWMCEVIRDHHQETGKKIGIKPSGGIHTYQDAIAYFDIVGDILDSDWQNPNLFRIGASSLYDALIEAYKTA